MAIVKLLENIVGKDYKHQRIEILKAYKTWNSSTHWYYNPSTDEFQ